jgi:hypothetical protein
MRINGEAGVLARKAPPRRGKIEIVAHDIHEVRGIAAIQHGEIRCQVQRLGVFAQQAIGNRVKRPGPQSLRRRRGDRPHPHLLGTGDDLTGAAEHLGSGAATEG